VDRDLSDCDRPLTQRFFLDREISGNAAFVYKLTRMARPQFKPTAALRKKVSEAAGHGMSHEEISIGLGIARGTLLKYFAAELTRAAYAKRIEVAQAMFRSAKRGNVAAQKAYLASTPRAAAPPPPMLDAKTPKLGKKEQAQADAKNAQAGTDWDDLIGPSASLQ